MKNFITVVVGSQRHLLNVNHIVSVAPVGESRAKIITSIDGGNPDPTIVSHDIKTIVAMIEAVQP